MVMPFSYFICLKAGNKASATVQPFLLLHVDIHLDSVHTIEDALHLFSTPETLEGYKTLASGKVCHLTNCSITGAVEILDKIDHFITAYPFVPSISL